MCPPELKLADGGKGVLKAIGRRIIPPEVRLPDDFQIVKVQAPPAPVEAKKSAPAPAPAAAPAPAPVEAKKSDLDQLLESEVSAAEPKPAAEVPVEGVAEDAPLPEAKVDSEPCAKEE